MEPSGGRARLRAADSRFSQLAEGGWRPGSRCGYALETALAAGYSSDGRMVPDDYDPALRRAEGAAGCQPTRGRKRAELVKDEQFPPLSAMEDLQATVWLENRYGFELGDFVFEDHLPSYKDPSRLTNYEPLRASDLRKLRPRELLRPGETEEAIWMNAELINFYLALLRKTVVDRYGGESKLFVFPTDLYSFIESELRLGSASLRHRDTVEIRKRMLEVGSRMIFPIHDSGNHWIVCAVVVTGPGEGEFRDYDSLSTAFAAEYRSNLRRWLSEEYSLLLERPAEFALALKDVASGDEASYLRQENFYDCGVFAMFVARGLVLRHVYHGQARLVPPLPNFLPRNVALRSDYMRRVLAIELVNHRVPFSDWKK